MGNRQNMQKIFLFLKSRHLAYYFEETPMKLWTKIRGDILTSSCGTIKDAKMAQTWPVGGQKQSPR